ncbi:MAG TPA: heavy-metal-associated domain-containing protein, partial [Anaerolinea sp.]|nr:heavy-metal-associated domain-containing protein [Anaerolinea sp.]
ERATVEFDPSKAGLPEIIGRVERAGYGVASGEADLAVGGIQNEADARRLEAALSVVSGVLSVEANQTTQKVQVRYIPTLVSQADLRRAA